MLLKALAKQTKKGRIVEGQKLKPVTILGAGSWGTALALYLARRGQTVRIWSIDASEITAMLAEKANNRYLPSHTLLDSILPIADLAEAVKDIEDVIVVVPSIGFRDTLTAIKPLINSHTRITCASKGLDANTGKLLSEIASEVLSDNKFAVLSGPSFAREVAAGLPTAVVIATQDKPFLADLFMRFNSPYFRIETSDDIIGVEVGGVVKNVIAIATGIADGLQFGANARSALITRGLGEMIRLGCALGGKMETFIGLAGLGDLILTCSDNQSRNRRLGLALGKGHNIQEAEREIGQVVEGKRNAELVTQLAHQHQLSMPICEAIWQILQGKVKVREVFLSLL